MRIRIRDPESLLTLDRKIRLRDKHPRSATLAYIKIIIILAEHCQAAPDIKKLFSHTKNQISLFGKSLVFLFLFSVDLF
jgi:hypothetical protein